MKKGSAKTVRRSPGTALLNAPYLLWAALFIVIPLFLVLYYALIDGEGHFTLNNLKELGDYLPVIADQHASVFNILAHHGLDVSVFNQ